MIASTKKFLVGSVSCWMVWVGAMGCVRVLPEPGGEETASGKRECTSDATCVFDGVPNRALGNAKLRLNAARNLIVENIGSSGLDGVRQFAVPANNVVMATGIACPNFVESVQGSRMEIIMYGDVPFEVISRLIAENTDGDNITTEADLSPIGVTLYTVQVFNNEELVGEVRDLRSSLVLLTGRRDYVDVLCGIHPGNLVWIQYALTFPGPIEIGETQEEFVGDRVRVKGQDQGVKASRQTAFDNLFANIPSVEMTYQAIDSEFNEE